MSINTFLFIAAALVTFYTRHASILGDFKVSALHP